MPKTVNPLLQRKSSSPFSTAQRTKPASRKSSLKDDAAERLDDIGGRPSLAPAGVPQNVVRIMKHIRDSAFEDVPDRAAGMNSEQISATLRFRAALPPVVSLAHLHALSESPTSTERELARLVAMGKVRKVTIPGRGKGGSAVGEGVALVEDWKGTLHQENGIDSELKQKYISLMDAHPASPTTPISALTDTEIKALVTAGYLTNPPALTSALSNPFSPPSLPHSSSSSISISQAGHTAATGTLGAVGGHGAIQESGGGGSMLATQDTRPSSLKHQQREMTFSLPNTGSYLKLLTCARIHLLYLLKQISPRHKEATKDFLEEKWNGNVLNDAISVQKRMRGEWSGVLPGKTKRWREFYGLRFEWVLAECVGSGLVELFDTGSVGVGVTVI